IARMRRNRLEQRTRRFTPARDEVVDVRASLKRSLRSGAEMIALSRRGRRRREPPLVVLADISGSMANYTRMFLHFLHALKSDRSRMHVFVFGTRLTNITRELERRDVDEALARVAAAVKDWSGGTRIGQSLKDFNFHWGRRVLGQGAHVVLMTDGLERDDPKLLEQEMARLARSAKRVVWLNPLLRFDRFEASAAGIRTMLPHTDEFRPVHNLRSLEDLAEALSYSARPEHASRRWLGRNGEAMR
ncbi:MAG TPA: VWA domain-containing protein, partial [Aestuariivirgaceae bacterium]|nr:VWA domain-containing protein [Aestuariivirgaceae bacterium]